MKLTIIVDEDALIQDLKNQVELRRDSQERYNRDSAPYAAIAAVDMGEPMTEPKPRRKSRRTTRKRK